MSIRIGRPIWFATGMWRSLSTPMLNHACQASLKRLAELQPMTWPGSWQNMSLPERAAIASSLSPPVRDLQSLDG